MKIRPDISIVTCAYNPNYSLFTKLYHAIGLSISATNLVVEWIIIDNSSFSPISEQKFLKSAKKLFSLKIVIEKEPGLTAARTRGIYEAKGEWIIFFDDDNEPESDYLNNCAKLIKQHPKVGIWGAGNIRVSFSSENVNPWIASKKSVFQERKLSKVEISNYQGWQAWYPIGTGMVARKDILIDYVKQLEDWNYNVSDRRGKSLTSGGDVQIVLHALKRGYLVGSSPELKLVHWISDEKSTTSYLLRHGFWISSSTLATHNQVYPDGAIEFSGITNLALLRIVYSTLRIYLIKEGFRQVLYRISKRFGECNARYIAYPTNKKPWILSWWENRIA